MSIGERIKAVRTELGKTQAELARDLDISVPALQGYEADKNVPGGAAIRAFITLGIDVEWLLTGEGEMYRDEFEQVASGLGNQAKPHGGGRARENLVESGQYALIPHYVGASVSAGAGAESGTDEVEKLAFRREWIKNRGLDRTKLALVRVVGDSMFPTLADGDLLMLDLRINSPKTNAIYAIEAGGDVRVKRLQTNLDGSVLVISDNPAYTPEVVQPSEAERLRVIGRAVWVGKSL